MRRRLLGVRPSSGQDQEVEDADTLVFTRGVLSSPPRPCPSSGAAHVMTGTISSF